MASNGAKIFLGVSLLILVIGIVLLIWWATNKTKYANLKWWGWGLFIVGLIMVIIGAVWANKSGGTSSSTAIGGYAGQMPITTGVGPVGAGFMGSATTGASAGSGITVV
jgi:hypothetical protein